MTGLSFGAGIWAFGRIVDRYATDGYGPDRGTSEMLLLASQVDGLAYLDINHPFVESDTTAESVAVQLADLGLKARAVTPHIYTREFARGAFTHPDPRVRALAKDRVRAAVEVARVLDAGYVKFWPGQDGFDMPAQVDHRRMWELTVEAIGELASESPDVRFAIEYKPKEPRVSITLANAPKTLLAIAEAGVDNVGVVLDFGHSLMAGESPAEALHLVHRHGRLVSAELNDNWRGWDDDLPVASVHLFETVEFLLALREIGWSEPLLLDQFPFREDPVAAVAHSIRLIRWFEALIDGLDVKELRDAQEAQDALAVQRILWSAVAGSGLRP
ncbi:MAG: TIM barrel protein [Streptomycetaceae bacterium]|nr:TIM barrel protein [Streptomycetaceae bacterium]